MQRRIDRERPNDATKRRNERTNERTDERTNDHQRALRMSDIACRFCCRRRSIRGSPVPTPQHIITHHHLAPQHHDSNPHHCALWRINSTTTLYLLQAVVLVPSMTFAGAEGCAERSDMCNMQLYKDCSRKRVRLYCYGTCVQDDMPFYTIVSKIVAAYTTQEMVGKMCIDSVPCTAQLS